VSKKRAVIPYSYDTYVAQTKQKSYIFPYNSSQVETCPQQPSAPAYLEIMGDLWDQFPPTIVVSTLTPIQEHCIIVCSGL